MRKACLFTCGTLFAASMAPAYAQIDDFVTRSAVSITGTYTETSNNGLSMGDYQIAPSTSGFVGRRAIFINPDSEFDYAVGYTYHIPCTSTHFFMSYDHYRTEDENSAFGDVVNIEISPILNTQVSDTARVEQHSDEFRVGFAHYLDFGRAFVLDLSGFFEWDKVSRSLYETAAGEVLFGNSSFAIASRSTDSKMDGWGPGMGVMAIIKPFNDPHWGFFVDVKTSLLWVENTFSQSLQNSQPPLALVGDYSLDPEGSESMVGKLDMKFGIDYCKVFPSAMFEAALGMRYMNIINALKNGNTFFNPFWPNLSYAANTGFPNDWGRIGPFLTFRVGGKDA